MRLGRASHRFLLIMIACLSCIGGCTDPSANPYGAIEGAYARSSINGLGAHKKLWEQAGARCIYPRRLSGRLENVDTIVLVSQDYDPPGMRAREWIEDWLKRESGRSVIYFGRDFNAELHYLSQTVDSVPEGSLPLVRQRIASVKTAEIQDRLQSYSENTFCGWFYIDTRQTSHQITEYEGPWANRLPGDKNSYWPLRTRLLPPKRSYRLSPPSWIVNPPKKPASSVAVNPANPIPVQNQISPTESDEDKVVFRSRWEADELNSQEEWDSQFNDIIESQILLKSSDDEPLVFRLKDSKRLGDGQIIVVANGAPFLNGSIVDPLLGQVSANIVNECLPAKKVAFIAYGDNGLQISMTNEIDSRGIGIEMLVAWPLSAITLPACVLGLITCIYLLPILGRPQSLPERSVSDFGMHVEAVGQLLRDAGDQAYARRTIADYYLKVRNESPPDWLSSHPN